MIRIAIIAAACVVVAALFWRSLAAWWCLDEGDLAFVRGDAAAAQVWLERGLALEPAWHALLEDHARVVMDADPVLALAQLREADCGQPCLAEEGDAESRLGRPFQAVDDYLTAHAVDRVAAAVQRLADLHRYDDAIGLERAMANRLGNGMLAQADLASTDYVIGTLDERAATAAPPDRAGQYHDDALFNFREAARLAPMHEDYLLSLGYAELQWGDRESARAAFERVLDLHPRQSEAERGLAAVEQAPRR